MARQIDTKYMTTGELYRLDGTPIPLDEPLILFRGRDKLLLKTLEYYKSLRVKSGTSSKRLRLLEEQAKNIQDWQTRNPDRLQTPE